MWFMKAKWEDELTAEIEEIEALGKEVSIDALKDIVGAPSYTDLIAELMTYFYDDRIVLAWEAFDENGNVTGRYKMLTDALSCGHTADNLRGMVAANT